MTDPFYFKDGTEVSNVKELYTTLNEVGEEEFGYHVSSEKNDFADWIEHSLGKKKLAKKVRKKQSIDGLKNVLKQDVKDTTVSASDFEDRRRELQNDYNVSTEAPHVFILKEFLFGALFGLVLGLILTAILIRAGLFF